jgi:hypothetical protein
MTSDRRSGTNCQDTWLLSQRGWLASHSPPSLKPTLMLLDSDYSCHLPTLQRTATQFLLSHYLLAPSMDSHDFIYVLVVPSFSLRQINVSSLKHYLRKTVPVSQTMYTLSPLQRPKNSCCLGSCFVTIWSTRIRYMREFRFIQRCWRLIVFREVTSCIALYCYRRLRGV